jgi:hypothetical protein
LKLMPCRVESQLTHPWAALFWAGVQAMRLLSMLLEESAPSGFFL